MYFWNTCHASCFNISKFHLEVLWNNLQMFRKLHRRAVNFRITDLFAGGGFSEF